MNYNKRGKGDKADMKKPTLSFLYCVLLAVTRSEPITSPESHEQHGTTAVATSAYGLKWAAVNALESATTTSSGFGLLGLAHDAAGAVDKITGDLKTAKDVAPLVLKLAASKMESEIDGTISKLKLNSDASLVTSALSPLVKTINTGIEAVTDSVKMISGPIPGALNETLRTLTQTVSDLVETGRAYNINAVGELERSNQQLLKLISRQTAPPIWPQYQPEYEPYPPRPVPYEPRPPPLPSLPSGRRVSATASAFSRQGQYPPPPSPNLPQQQPRPFQQPQPPFYAPHGPYAW